MLKLQEIGSPIVWTPSSLHYILYRSDLKENMASLESLEQCKITEIKDHEDDTYKNHHVWHQCSVMMV